MSDLGEHECDMGICPPDKVDYPEEPNVYISFPIAQTIYNWYEYYYQDKGKLKIPPLALEFIKQIESIIDKE
jgi:hypothetical protein